VKSNGAQKGLRNNQGRNELRIKTGWHGGLLALQSPGHPDVSHGATAVLRDSASSAWDSVVRHQFFDQLIDGSLPTAAFHRYLAQEYVLMDNMIALTGSSIAAAPSLAERVTLGRYIGSISAHENTYYRRAFAVLSRDAGKERRAKDDLSFARFREFVDDITTRGGYAEKLAILYGVAGSKLAGADRAGESRPKLPHYAEWIDLHVNRMFREAVQNVTYQLEHWDAAMVPNSQARLIAVFTETLAGIRTMLDAALGAEGDVPASRGK
jgi:thiaminase/transcriptional activator TenA